MTETCGVEEMPTAVTRGVTVTCQVVSRVACVSHDPGLSVLIQLTEKRVRKHLPLTLSNENPPSEPLILITIVMVTVGMGHGARHSAWQGPSSAIHITSTGGGWGGEDITLVFQMGKWGSETFRDMTQAFKWQIWALNSGLFDSKGPVHNSYSK